MTEHISISFSDHALHRYKRVQRLLDELDPADEPRALVVPGSPRPCGTIIVFPGSFNPPTSAHIALLKQAHNFTLRQAPALLYAAFSKRTVDKENVERPLLLDRILLLQTLLQHRIPHSGIVLFNRGLYVEEAEAIRASFPGVRRLFFLLGYDKIVQIFDPHYYDQRDAALTALFHLAELLVAPRGKGGEREIMELLHRPENVPFADHVHVLPLDHAYRDISSTQIREGIVGAHDEVPREVRKFMRETRAYAPPLRLSDGTEVDYYNERMKRLKDLGCMPRGTM